MKLGFFETVLISIVIVMIFNNSANYIVRSWDNYQDRKREKRQKLLLLKLKEEAEKQFKLPENQKAVNNFIQKHISNIMCYDKMALEEHADVQCNYSKVSKKFSYFYDISNETIFEEYNINSARFPFTPSNSIRIMDFDNRPYWQTEQALSEQLLNLYKERFTDQYIQPRYH